MKLLPKIYELLEFGKIREELVDIYRKEPKDDFIYGFCNLFEPEKCAKSCHRDAICVQKGGDYVCECQEGFTGNGFKCKPSSDPCLNGKAKCGKNTDCKVTKRDGHKCTCLPGYKGWPDDIGCYDLDECVTGTHQCQARVSMKSKGISFELYNGWNYFLCFDQTTTE